MIDYNGIPCPVCESEFTEQDDIVVCSICGAPHHRECYTENGKCAYDEKHLNGEKWIRPNVHDKEADEQNASKQPYVVCSNCGYKNPTNSDSCEHCHVPMQKVSPGEGQNPYVFLLDPLGGVAPTDKSDDVTMGDLAKYVKINTPYYIPIFSKISKKMFPRFNFAAFFFPGSWLLFRKNYLLGGIVTVIDILLNVLYTTLSVYIAFPVLEQFAIKNNISFDFSAYTTAPPNSLTEAVLNNKANLIFVLLISLIPIFMFAEKVIIGVFANKWYHNGCVKNVKKIHADTPAPESYQSVLTEKGGVNMPLCIISYTLLLFASQIIIPLA